MTLADITLARIDALIAEQGLLTHPFYQAWSAGTLTGNQLAGYARHYYQHVAAFPRYLALAYAGCDDLATRQMLLENLRDEEGGTVTHPEMWLRFADSLGNSRLDVFGAPQMPETKEADATFRAAMTAGTSTALGALYAYEAQIPAVAHTKIAGLDAHYPELKANAGYFHVHESADVVHAGRVRELLAKRIINEADASEAYAGAEASILATRRILDGICLEFGVEAPCMN
ncbi:MAG: CADD family putative folate metabolism protein [bacterium]